MLETGCGVVGRKLGNDVEGDSVTAWVVGASVGLAVTGARLGWTDIVGTSFVVDDLSCYDDLLDGGQYQWRIQATDSRGGMSAMTNFATFTLEKVAPPTMPTT